MGPVTGAYRLFYSKTCQKQIATLHPHIKPIVRSRLDLLRSMPYAGKRLERELAGYRSLRASRFRIIYRIDEDADALEIHYVGHRRDVYELLADGRRLTADR
ncbi:MAG: type II toxin-antitoxin system RelE/ParE family toxin [Desulfobacterales bacterium]|nr:type II toxin-antitoxin system RelE/ParE family toxin [Desulfobacterales bacterium]